MFGLGRFSRKSQPPVDALIVARLNARVQPMDRGEYFEDPLDEVLQDLKIGKVTGGGTQLADEPDGIEFCDVEVECIDCSDHVTGSIVKALEKLGAPRGSRLLLDNDQKDIPFGKFEGLGLFLNGTDLPDEVYANSDVNEIISECGRRMKGIGEFRSHWQGSRETALYFYGTSFSGMKSAISEFIENDPGCALSRFVQIA